MSLIDDMMEPCVIMNKITASDGEGGLMVEWKEGAVIDAAITNDTSLQAKVAESQGVTSTYTITTRRGVVLAFPDVIKRISDGKVFRVTSDGSDKISPKTSTLNMCQVTAEKWRLT